MCHDLYLTSLSGLTMVIAAKKILIGHGQSLSQFYLRFPTQSVQSAIVHQLVWGSVGLICVKPDLPLVISNAADALRQLPDRNIVTHTDINMTQPWWKMVVVGFWF